MVDPACEVNEKGNREKNDGNEVPKEATNPPLELGSYEILRRMKKPYPMQKRLGKPRADRGSQEQGAGQEKTRKEVQSLRRRLRSGQNRPEKDSRRRSGSRGDNLVTGYKHC